MKPTEKVSVPKGMQAGTTKGGGSAGKVAPSAKATNDSKPSSKTMLGGKGTGNRF